VIDAAPVVVFGLARLSRDGCGQQDAHGGLTFDLPTSARDPQARHRVLCGRLLLVAVGGGAGQVVGKVTYLGTRAVGKPETFFWRGQFSKDRFLILRTRNSSNCPAFDPSGSCRMSNQPPPIGTSPTSARTPPKKRRKANDSVSMHTSRVKQKQKEEFTGHVEVGTSAIPSTSTTLPLPSDTTISNIRSRRTIVHCPDGPPSNPRFLNIFHPTNDFLFHFSSQINITTMSTTSPKLANYIPFAMISEIGAFHTETSPPPGWRSPAPLWICPPTGHY